MGHTLGDVWAPRIRDCMCCDLLLEPICRPNMLYDLPRSLHSKQFLTAHVQTYRSISSDEYNKKNIVKKKKKNINVCEVLRNRRKLKNLRQI